MMRRPPRSTLFPDTPLFRSARRAGDGLDPGVADPRGPRPGVGRAGDRGPGPRDAGIASRGAQRARGDRAADRKSTRLNSSHANISYAVFCLKKKVKRTLPAM